MPAGRWSRLNHRVIGYQLRRLQMESASSGRPEPGPRFRPVPGKGSHFGGVTQKMDLVVVFFVICAIAWLRKGWVLPSRLATRPRG